MPIREATADDWPRIWPFWHRIVAAGETYTWDRDTTEEAARALWMAPAKRVFVAEDDTGAVVGSAYVTPNYGGPAARIAGAGFMVFNAVVETNPAVTLWTSLGFTILGTVPEAYEHPRLGRVGLHVMYRAL
jgi:hypothetical protein